MLDSVFVSFPFKLEVLLGLRHAGMKHSCHQGLSSGLPFGPSQDQTIFPWSRMTPTLQRIALEWIRCTYSIYESYLLGHWKSTASSVPSILWYPFTTRWSVLECQLKSSLIITPNEDQLFGIKPHCNNKADEYQKMETKSTTWYCACYTT